MMSVDEIVELLKMTQYYEGDTLKVYISGIIKLLEKEKENGRQLIKRNK